MRKVGISGFGIVWIFKTILSIFPDSLAALKDSGQNFFSLIFLSYFKDYPPL